MPTSAENVKLGVCTVLFDGVNLGYTKGGVEVSVETTTHEVTVDQFGETAIGEYITGRKVGAKVPLAETTLDNLIAIMPGSQLISDGAKATGTVTLSVAAPVNGDKVNIGGQDFTWKTTPVNANDMPIVATFSLAAAALAAAINASSIPYVATVNAGVVTITGKTRGTDLNVAITKSFVTTANCAVVGMTGGTAVTKAQVKVNSGININLLSVAKVLILRPKGTTGAEDFTIYKAACPGALSFNYQTGEERIYSADFKGYVLDTGDLFAVGDITAV